MERRTHCKKASVPRQRGDERLADEEHASADHGVDASQSDSRREGRHDREDSRQRHDIVERRREEQQAWL